MKVAELPVNESERLDALKRYNILDTKAEQAFNDLSILAAQICHSPMSLVTFVDENRHWFKASCGLDACETSRDLGFCAHALLNPEDLLIIPDALADERFADNPLVISDPYIRFYAGSPLITPDGYALGTLCVLDHVPRELSSDQLNALESLSRQVVNQLELRFNLAALAGANHQITLLNEQLTAENLRMGAELDIARQIQLMILPKPDELERIEGLDIVGFMEPAAEVGGDYYDVLQTDGIVTLGIGDVTGHGLESGLLMLMTQTAVRTLQEVREQNPVRFLDAINRTIYHNVQRMDSERNLTLAILNYAQGMLSISGQHEETLVVRATGTVERIDMMDLGLPVGLDVDIANFVDHVTVELQPGDGVVLYTDGISEAYNEHRQQYGVDRLCQVLSEHWQGTAKTINQAVMYDLYQFIGHEKIVDDITLLILKRLPT